MGRLTDIWGVSAGLTTIQSFTNPVGAAAGLANLLPVGIMAKFGDHFLRRRR